jgi:hypothetical protein
MLKFIGLLVAAGLVVLTTEEAQARGRRCCSQPVPSCCTPALVDQAAAPVTDPNLSTGQIGQDTRRFSYQPVQPVQPTYYYAPAYRPRPVDRYMIPKNEAARFSIF